MILCAIGGDDTYRLLPYLFEHNELANVVSDKIFLGFSDTTINHFMLHKAGLKTFYGQSFLADICEPGKEMLPYTKKYFEELIRAGTIKEVKPSEEKMPPQKYRNALLAIKETGICDVLSGVLIGKPADEIYAQEYKEILIDTIGNPTLPIACNVNIGHAQPRCIIPFGVAATVDINNQVIRFSM